MHPSLLLHTPQYSRQCTKGYVIIVMGAARPESGLFSKRPKCTKVYVIIVMGAVRPVARLNKAEIRHGLLVFRKCKFAELIGIWAWVCIYKKD